MLVLSLIVLTLQCVEFFYFVHRFCEFCECFVVFFDKHIFFLWWLVIIYNSVLLFRAEGATRYAFSRNGGPRTRSDALEINTLSYGLAHSVRHQH